jgi:hypothetical protein
MDNDEAKLILAACRAHGQETNDPAMAEALAQAERDPELRKWFEEEIRFDQVVCSCLEQVLPPADLKRHILAGHRAGQTPRATRTIGVPLGMAAAIVLTFGVGYYTGGLDQTADGFALADYRQSMINVIETGVDFDAQSSRFQELADFVALKSAPAIKDLPAALQGDAVMGCKIVSWKNNKVSLFCFRNQAGEIVHLFVTEVNQSMSAGLATADKIIARVNNVPTVSWTDRGRQYLLTGHTPDTDLSGYY